MEENDGEMEEFFSVKASQKMDVFSDSKNVPHVTCRVGVRTNNLIFCFS